MSSFYTEEELTDLGLDEYGSNVRISRNASLYNPEQISVGDNVRIDDFCILSGHITIGSHVHIAPFCGLYGKYGIKLEDFTGLSSRVSIYSSRDDFSGESLTNPTIPDTYRPELISGEVILRKHVVVGASSVILPDVVVEEGAVVGALSLVRNNILSSWQIHFGIPTRPIQDRNRNQVLKLEDQYLEAYRNGDT